MKKTSIILSILLLGLTFIFGSNCIAEDQLRDYDGIKLDKGTFIPVISAQEISTSYSDVNSQVKFISSTDLYLSELNVIPRNTEFFGYIEKLNEPVVGTNASMIIKISKMKLSDGFEAPVRGYIYTSNNNLIGGEMTAPASYDKNPSYRMGFIPVVGFVPGSALKMGTHTVIASGADLLIILTSPLFITHTVTN